MPAFRLDARVRLEIEGLAEPVSAIVRAIDPGPERPGITVEPDGMATRDLWWSSGDRFTTDRGLSVRVGRA